MSEQIEYDSKNNPFKDLPFDLTSIVFEGVNFIPLTYTFPNNIKEYKTPYLDTYQLEYKYDENNNPIKASVYYLNDSNPKELDYEIEYSYITKKVEINKLFSFKMNKRVPQKVTLFFISKLYPNRT